MVNISAMLLSGTFVGLFAACHNDSRSHEAGRVLPHDDGTIAFVDTAPTAEGSASSRTALVHVEQSWPRRALTLTL